MGYQIIKQPDGQFALYSSYTDMIAVWNATADEVVEFFVDRARKDAETHARRQLAFVAAGEPREAYFQFAKTWEQALEMDREHGGEAHRAWGVRDDDGGTGQ